MTYLTRFTIVLLFSLLFVPMTVGAAGVWSPSASDTYGTSVQNPTLTSGTAGLSSQSTGVPGTVGGYIPLEPLSPHGNYANFADYLATMYKLAITVGALIAVVMLVTGGVRYMLSESFTDIDKAKKRIISALWGLTILIGSFLILYTINPNLLTFNLALPNVNQSASQFKIPLGNTTPKDYTKSSLLPALQYNDVNAKDVGTLKSIGDYSTQCVQSNGTPIVTAGSEANTSAVTCQTIPGLGIF